MSQVAIRPTYDERVRRVDELGRDTLVKIVAGVWDELDGVEWYTDQCLEIADTLREYNLDIEEPGHYIED